jgi:hypothetical protein
MVPVVTISLGEMKMFILIVTSEYNVITFENINERSAIKDNLLFKTSHQRKLKCKILYIFQFCFCFCHVIASFIILKIMPNDFGLRILVELIKCVG